MLVYSIHKVRGEMMTDRSLLTLFRWLINLFQLHISVQARNFRLVRHDHAYRWAACLPNDPLVKFLLLAVFIDSIPWFSSCSLSSNFAWKTKANASAFPPIRMSSHALLDGLVSFFDDYLFEILVLIGDSATKCFGDHFLCVLQWGFIEKWDESIYFILGINNAPVCCICSQQVIFYLRIHC